jgi:CHAT domain-containing protein/predicted negative regulator of RcsB-dependent stress response
MMNYENSPDVGKRAFTQFLHLAATGFILCFLLISPSVAANEEIRISPASLPLIQKIEADETHYYSIELKANEITGFKFEKEDLRFTYDAFDPEGNHLFHGFYQKHGTVEPWFITTGAGVYRFKITSLEKNSSGYGYSFEITSQRAATKKDRLAFEAEKKFQQAEELRSKWAAHYLESALALYDEAVAVWQQQKHWARLTAAFERSGEIYLIFGNYEKSMEAYRRALNSSRSAGDRIAELQQYCNIARVYSLLGDFRRAKQYLSNVKKTAETINLETDSPLLADMFNNLAEVLSAEGELGEARRLFDKALKIWRNLKHRQGEATGLRNLGYVNGDSGEIIDAEQNFEQALMLWRELGDLRGEAFTLTAQGHLRSFFLQSEAALNLHSSARDTFNFIGDRQGEAVALNGMGNIYEVLNRPGNAVDCYYRALQINKELGNQSYLAVTSFSLARAYRLAKNFEEAEKYYQESLTLCRKTNKMRLEAYILTALAGLSIAVGNEASALNRYRQTISFYKKIGDIRGEALIFGEIGNLYRKQNNLVLADKSYRDALRLSYKIGDNLGISSLMYHLAEIEFERENLSEARSLLENSISLAKQMREKLRTPTLKAAYQATNQNKIELLVDILIRSHQNDPQPQWVAATLEQIEQWRARMLLELLNETNIEPRLEVDPKLLKQEKELQNKLALKIEKDTSLRLLSGSSEELEKIGREISSLISEYDQLQAKIKEAEDPRYEKMVTMPPVASVADIQSALQKENNAVYLSYFLGARKSYVWLVDKTEIKVFELEDKAALEASAREFYRLLTARQSKPGETQAQLQERVDVADRAFCEQGEKLSRQLLGQVAPYLNGKRILISLDGALQYVPFEALPAPAQMSADGATPACRQNAEQLLQYTPILKTNEIVYVPSFSILNALRQDHGDEKTVAARGDRLAVWADPVYEPDDRRVKDKIQPSDNSDYFQDEQPLVPLRRLLNTRSEADEISGLWQPDEIAVATGLSANREKLLIADLGRYRFLHIAAHGLFNNLQPENSGLVLSQFNENGERIDGFLSLKDIFQMRLKADLVVLSACRSGLGEEFSGEGFTGLKHSFFYAGAKSMVVSLWQVDDQSTAALMREFYRALREDQLPTPAALQKAKAEVHRQGGWEHPFYWAAFTLHGDYSIARPAAPKSLFSNHYIVFFIIFFPAIVIFFCFYHIKRGRRFFGF